MQHLDEMGKNNSNIFPYISLTHLQVMLFFRREDELV